MNSNKTLSISLLILGEIIIIISFLYFGRNNDINILILNTIVSSIIYSLFFIDILIPIIDFSNKSQNRIGSVGLRWFFTIFYSITAVGIMLTYNIYKPIDFFDQVIIHSILVFFLALGLFFSISASQKVKNVFDGEDRARRILEEMKNETISVLRKTEQRNDMPDDIIIRIKSLSENIRFISPSNDIKAYELEKKYVNDIQDLDKMLFNAPLNIDKISEVLRKCETTYNTRKQNIFN